jgi:hypothetical protein
MNLRKGGDDQMKSLPVKLGVVLIGSLIFLTSCSSSPNGGKWVKPDSGESEFEKDYNECRNMALQQCADTVWPGYVVAKNCVNNLTKDCLNSRGWEYRKP